MSTKKQSLQNNFELSGGPHLDELNPAQQVRQKAIVFIVNGEEGMRKSLGQMARSAKWDTQLYSSAESFLNDFNPVTPSCLLLDVDVPSMGGFTLQARVHERYNLLPIIFVSSRGTVPEAVQALQSGATDFIIKPFTQSMLLARIQECIEKNRSDWEAQREREEVIARMAELTPREYEVMELVVKGKLNKVIASELNISIKTVEIHRAQVMKKLRVQGQAELIRIAMLAGIAEPINSSL